MAKVEGIMSAMREWLESLTDTIGTDGVLSAPRAKDIIVTFSGDTSVDQPQLPAAVMELHVGVKAASGYNVADFHGTLRGTIYILDEASSVDEVRAKLVRWIDVLQDHCSHQTAYIGFAGGRMTISDFAPTIGRRKDLTLGDENICELQAQFELSV